MALCKTLVEVRKFGKLKNCQSEEINIMDKLFFFICVAFILNYQSDAQPPNVKIKGPTCIKVRDTVTYTISQRQPGYSWIMPRDMIVLYWSGDSSITCVVVSNLSHQPVVYSQSVTNWENAVVLKVNYPIESPVIFAKFKESWLFKDFVVSKDSPTVIIETQLMRMPFDKIRYEWQSDNPTWTFGKTKLPILLDSTLNCRSMLLNIPSGKGKVYLKLIGSCNSITNVIEIRKE